MGPPGFRPSVTVSTSRNFKIRGVTFENEDGTSRQELLDMIKEKEPPFDGDLQISLERYEHDRKTAYYVNVNGYIVGSVESSMSQYITENYDKISGIHDFYVGSFQAEDTGETVYYANARLSVRLEEPAQEICLNDHAAARSSSAQQSTQRLTLFLDAQALSSLNLGAFMEYSNMVQDAASAVMDGGDADPDYADSLTNELSLIRTESSARSIALKTHNSKYKEKKESSSQTSDPDKERWVFLMAAPLFLAGAILCAIAKLAIISIVMFIIASVYGVFAVVSLYKHWSLEENDEPDDDEE